MSRWPISVSQLCRIVTQANFLFKEFTKIFAIAFGCTLSTLPYYTVILSFQLWKYRGVLYHFFLNLFMRAIFLLHVYSICVCYISIIFPSVRKPRDSSKSRSHNDNKRSWILNLAKPTLSYLICGSVLSSWSQGHQFCTVTHLLVYVHTSLTGHHCVSRSFCTRSEWRTMGRFRPCLFHLSEVLIELRSLCTAHLLTDFL